MTFHAYTYNDWWNSRCIFDFFFFNSLFSILSLVWLKGDSSTVNIEENGGIQFSQSTRVPEPLRTAMANHSTRLRKAERENRALREGECQQWCYKRMTARGSDRSLAERMKRLSFDGPVDEIKFRGCARRQESGTRERWKWTALFGQRNKNIHLAPIVHLVGTPTFSSMKNSIVI